MADPKRQKRYAVGIAAEKRVAGYLENLGFDIVNERYKTPYGEIDLIGLSNQVLTFVEVKARKSLSEGLHSVTPKSQRRISNAAQLWLAENADKIGEQHEIRFDVAIVTPDGSISYMKSAFQSES